MRFLFLTGLLLLKSGFAPGQSVDRPAAESAYQEAVAAMNVGQTARGFQLLDQALARQPDHHEALYARAYYHHANGTDEEAIRACRVLLSAYPGDTAAFLLRGQANAELARYEAAEADFRRAWSLDSTDFHVHNELGHLFYAQDDYERARMHFDRSLALRANGFAHEYRARMLYNEAQPAAALREVERLIALEPGNPDALRLKAQIFVAMNKDGEAIKLYTGLQKQNQLTEYDLLNWGLIYYYQKKYPSALTYFAILKKHDVPDLYYFKALTEYRMRKFETALQSIDQAIALADPEDEESAPYFHDRALIQQALPPKKGPRPNAGSDYLRAVALTPEIVDGRNYGGDTLELLGSAKQALRGTYTPRQLDSARVRGYQRRATRLADGDAYPEALAETEKAWRLDSLDAYTYHLRGRCRLAEEAYAPAIRDFERALRPSGNPVADQTYHLRGLAYAGLEMYPRAVADFDQAITLNGGEAEYFYNRAFAHAGTNDFTRALADATQAIELQPAESEYRLGRAEFYLGDGQFDQTLGDCNHVLATETDNADAYYYRGAAYEGLKNYSLALREYAQALHLDPEFTEARQALEEVTLKAGK
ncbi:MAG: tetratricopeptide repeat protein [Ferruginibacter sp.]|nr:tetratricopeptide repeat protein [Cytophagales bacterium]